MSRRGFYPDFLAFWYAARAFVHGLDPYAVSPSAAPYFVGRSVFLSVPERARDRAIAGLPLAAAGALFFGFQSALLAFAITRDDLARLPLFLSFRT
jgi:hypothetical protein